MNKCVFAIACSALIAPAAASAASLVLVPSSSTYAVGNAFTILVQVQPEGQSLRKVKGQLAFDASALTLVSIDEKESMISSWLQKPILSSASGKLAFEGIVHPGFSENSGTIFAATFRAKVQGVKTLNFSQGSITSQEDANILTSLGEGRYNFIAGTQPEKNLESSSEEPGASAIASLTHPDQTQWYSHNDPIFAWSVQGDIDKVSYAFDQKEDTDPEYIDESPISKKSYKDIADGIWYFHLNTHNTKGWSEVSHYKILIDTESPEEFELNVEERKDLTQPQMELRFSAQDARSGIDRYEVQIGAMSLVMLLPEEIAYETPVLAPGEWTIEVRSYDKAGNSRAASTVRRVEPLIAPSILMHVKKVKGKEILAMTGITAYPNASLRVYFQDASSREILGPFEAKVDGTSWHYRHPGYLPDGEYESWAMVKDERGAVSMASERVAVAIGSPWYMKTAMSVAEYLALAGALVTIPAGTGFLAIAALKGARRLFEKRPRKKNPYAKKRKRSSL
ncbi:MAG: hypothetical protein HYT50_02205 [Candidatus Wildermuthbacteria bacterium]|nr:hypothetical protein [Candidatus Wildermuthbacteria bacterium]